jgi:hypothetical protein
MHVDYRSSPGRWSFTRCSAGARCCWSRFCSRRRSTRRSAGCSWGGVDPALGACQARPGAVPRLPDRQEARAGQRAGLLVPAAGRLFTGPGAGLILLQPDLGTAVLIGATAFVMLFLAGSVLALDRPAWCGAPAALGVLVMAEPYRRARLLAFLDPEKDPLGSGFQALQSLIAVGSGGCSGWGRARACRSSTSCPTRSRTSSTRSSPRSWG